MNAVNALPVRPESNSAEGSVLCSDSPAGKREAGYFKLSTIQKQRTRYLGSPSSAESLIQTF